MGEKDSPTNIDGEIKIKRAQNSTWEGWNKMYNNLLCIFFIFKKTDTKFISLNNAILENIYHMSASKTTFFFLR